MVRRKIRQRTGLEVVCAEREGALSGQTFLEKRCFSNLQEMGLGLGGEQYRQGRSKFKGQARLVGLECWRRNKAASVRTDVMGLPGHTETVAFTE